MLHEAGDIAPKPNCFTKLQYLACFIAFIALATLYLVPLSDIDIWWHLATGRYFVSTGSLLTTDPFGLAGGEITPGREVLLNGYWLSQVGFYGIDRLFGLYGVVFLRVVLLLVPPIIVLVYGWRNFRNSVFVLPVALLCGWAMVSVDGIRPNHLTIACVPVIVALLASVGFVADGQRAYRLRLACWLPVLMLGWANAHGGFLLGVVLVILYVGGETVTRLLSKQPLRPLRGVWAIAAVTVLVSFFTPNGIEIYRRFIFSQGGVLQQKTSEFLSPLALAKSGTLIYWPFFIMVFLVLSLFVVRRGRVALTRAGLLVALTVIGFSAFRYAPLFIGGASILLISECGGDEVKAIWQRLVLAAGGGLVVFLVLMAVTSFPVRAGALSRGAVAESRFPVAAVDFVRQAQLSGVVFNHFNWGGYLDWELAGQLTTFIDGRTLSLPLFHAYTRALWLPAETQSLFDQYAVEMVIMPRLNPSTGELYALTDFLWRSPQWALVYRDESAMILLRRNHEYLRQHREIGKDQIYRDVLANVAMLQRTWGRGGHLEKAAQVAAFRLGTATP